MSFTLSPSDEWEAFALAYAGCVVRVRHRRVAGRVTVEVFLPGVDEQLAASEQIDLEERWYLSVWLARAPVGRDAGPTAHVEYRLADDALAADTLDTEETAWLAIFTGPVAAT